MDFLVRVKENSKEKYLARLVEIFNMEIIQKVGKVLLPTGIKLTAIDGTGFDSWQNSRYYKKRINRTCEPYAKADIFIDVKNRKFWILV